MAFRSRRVILVCSLAISGAALGETPPDSSSTPVQLEEELVVTGSRVPRKDLTSPAPGVIYSREEIAARGGAAPRGLPQPLPWGGGGGDSQIQNRARRPTPGAVRH